MAKNKPRTPKPYGPRAARFTAPQEALDYFAGGAQARPYMLEEALLEGVAQGWASKDIPYKHVASKIPGASKSEVEDAARRLLAYGKVHLQNRKAYAVFVPSIPWTPVVSSNIKAVGYCVSHKSGVKSVLGVQFLSGTSYYYDCPREYATKMLAAPSKGKFLHWEIKVKNIAYSGPH